MKPTTASGHDQHEQADEKVASADFHGLMSVYWLVCASRPLERPRLPLK